MVLDYYVSGVWDEVILWDNCIVYEKYKFWFWMLVDVS